MQKEIASAFIARVVGRSAGRLVDRSFGCSVGQLASVCRSSGVPPTLQIWYQGKTRMSGTRLGGSPNALPCARIAATARLRRPYTGADRTAWSAAGFGARTPCSASATQRAGMCASSTSHRGTAGSIACDALQRPECAKATLFAKSFGFTARARAGRWMCSNAAVPLCSPCTESTSLIKLLVGVAELVEEANECLHIHL